MENRYALKLIEKIQKDLIKNSLGPLGVEKVKVSLFFFPRMFLPKRESQEIFPTDRSASSSPRMV